MGNPTDDRRARWEHVMRVQLGALLNDLTVMEIVLCWLRFLIECEREPEQPPSACPDAPRYALAV